jgi:small conductance mechanosensitive channel
MQSWKNLLDFFTSTTLSLGFDAHHLTVEPLLIEAAAKSGLEEPFVHILEIGNYAVTY